MNFRTRLNQEDDTWLVYVFLKSFVAFLDARDKPNKPNLMKISLNLLDVSGFGERESN